MHHTQLQRYRNVYSLPLFAAACLVFSATPSALATFHFMHIEQIIAGVNGNVNAQAIQLRMRVAGQNLVDKGRIIARDATGQNPIVLIDFDHTVANGTTGDRTLAATADFSNYTTPAAKPDFTLSHLIPQSYLAAGTITFETDDATLVVCRLSWGGSAYTGMTTASQTNDQDGELGPAFPGSLPTSGLQALQFVNALALSTTNANDYALTSGAAVFINNAGESFTVNELPTHGQEQQPEDGQVPSSDDHAESGNTSDTSNTTDTNNSNSTGNQNTSPPTIPATNAACPMGAALQGTLASFMVLLTVRWCQRRRAH